MRKIKEFFKSAIQKFCLDKKTNSMVMSVIELPIIIIGLIKQKYSLVLYGVIILAIINVIIKSIYSKILIHKAKKMLNDFTDYDVEDFGHLTQDDSKK